MAGLAVVVAATSVALLTTSDGVTNGRDLSATDPDDLALVALGRELYGAECARCHGAALEGQPDWRRRNEEGRLPAPPHDATGHTWHHPDVLLFQMTKNGLTDYGGTSYASDMPGFDGVLSDREIWAVLSYIKSTWPAPIRNRHDQINGRTVE